MTDAMRSGIYRRTEDPSFREGMRTDVDGTLKELGSTWTTIRSANFEPSTGNRPTSSSSRSLDKLVTCSAIGLEDPELP